MPSHAVLGVTTQVFLDTRGNHTLHEDASLAFVFQITLSDRHLKKNMWGWRRCPWA